MEETIELLINEINSFKVIHEKIIYFADDFFWNKETNELFNNNVKILMTPTENRLFQAFVRNMNRVLSVDDIILEIWNDCNNDKKETLKTTLKNLRKKLPKGLIANEYGIGYKLIS